MATPWRVIAALSCVVVSRGARKLASGLAQLATEGRFPCKLEVEYGMRQDEASLSFSAVCTDEVHDGFLDQPYLVKKDIGQIVSIPFDKTFKAGRTKLRTLRLEDEFEGASYVGKTFTFRAKTADGEEGRFSVKIVEPSEAAVAVQAKLDAGGLDCELGANPAKVEADHKALHHATTISIKCNKPVGDLQMIPPAPYSKKAYWTWPTDGAARRVATYDHVKLTGNKFYLTGNEGGEEKSTWVTVELDKTEWTEATPTEAPEEKDKPPVQIGDASCTLTTEYFQNKGSQERGVNFYVLCNHVVTEPVLKVGNAEMTLEDSIKADVKTLLGGLNADQPAIAGKVAWFEGMAGDKALKSNEVQLEGKNGEVSKPVAQDTDPLTNPEEASCVLNTNYFDAEQAEGTAKAVELWLVCSVKVTDGELTEAGQTFALQGDVEPGTKTKIDSFILGDFEGEIAKFQGKAGGKVVQSNEVIL